MSFLQLLNIWTDYTPLNIIIWFTVLVLLLYFAKNPAHKAIRSLCKVLHEGLMIMSNSVLSAEEKVKQRNREVLLTAGMEAVENHIEREFYRVNTVVERDLSGFPVLKRKLLDQISKIDEDYQQSSEIPPTPPEWIEAVESLAKLPAEAGDSKTVSNILKEIHKTTTNQHKTAMDEYRKAVGRHHESLNKLKPCWRKLTQTLSDVGKIITGLQERAVKIDKRMDEYEEIRSKSEKAERILSSSSMTQFFISGIVLAIAIGGAIINFNLIALPMSEMVGGSSYIGSFKTSDVAALVIIMVEIAMGLYLMESLRITRLFPIIRQMDDKMRRRMIWITFSILLTLAGIEAALALMRERIAMNNEALLMSLAGNEILHPTSSLIPTIGQIALSFILPFALTFVAIPLESFIHSSRTVLGFLTALSLRLFSFLLNLSAQIIHNLGEFFISIYDIVIFPPLWAEEILLKRSKHPVAPVVNIHENTSEDPAPDVAETGDNEADKLLISGKEAAT